MKTILHYSKSLVIGALLLMLSAGAFAQKTAVASGNWSTPGTWSPVGVPASTDDVIINDNIDVTVDEAAVCQSLTIAGGSESNAVTISGTNSLTVGGAIVINSGNGSGDDKSIVVGAGTLSATSVTMDVTGNDNRTNFITVSTGTVNITGDITMLDADLQRNQFLITGAGRLNIGGSITGGDLILNAASIVDYNNDGAQTVRPDTYTNLVLSGSGEKTTTGVTVNTRLTLQGTASAGNPITYSSAILEYNGSAAQNTSDNEFPATSGINELIINNPSGVTLNGAKTLNGDLILTTGTLVAGTNLTMGTSGTPVITRNEGSLSGTLQGAADYDVLYNGSSKTTGGELSGSGLRHIDIDLTTGETLTLDTDRSPDGTVEVTEGIFDIGGFTINRSVSGGAFNIRDGGWLRIGGTNTFPSNYGATTIGNVDGTVEYAGTDQTVATIANDSYTNVVLSGSGVKTFEAETILGVLSIRGSATTAGVAPTYGGSADLEYRGSVAQVTSDIEFPAAMTADLIINNPNGVTLNGTKTLSASLTLTSGVLTTSTSNLLIMPDNFFTVNGGSNASYINGPMRKVGNNSFTFPVGKAGIYSPISITNPDNNADAFQAEYRRESAAALGPVTAPGVFRVSNCEYWDLDEINNAGGANNIDVTVGWFPASGCSALPYITNASAITLVHFDEGGTNTWDNAGGTTSGDESTGTVTRTGVTDFSPFTLGSTIDEGNPLPVKLSHIHAFEKLSGIQVNWIAYQEENLSHYVVERSADGAQFTPIGNVVSQNTVNETAYGFFDASPLAGVNFYRIRNVDFDGKTGYSNIVKVNLDKTIKDIVLYPNPVRNGYLSVQSADLAKGHYNLRVFNAAGQLVYARSFIHAGGAINQTIALPAAAGAGLYTLLLDRDGNALLARRFVVQP